MGLTAIAIYAPGDIIASAWANVLRTNFSVLDARTGGDPAAAGKIAVSDGATSSIWTAGLTAVLNALGFTPVNKAGDTMAGALTAPGINVLGAAGVLVAGAGGVNVVGGPVQGGDKTTGGDLAVLGLNVGVHGIDSDAAIHSDGDVSGNTLTAISDVSASGNAGIGGSGTFGAAVGSPRFLSNVADGTTPPFVANAAQAAVVCTNVRAASAVVADSATTATLAANATSATAATTATNALALGSVTATATPTASKIPIADGSGTLNAWVTPAAGIPSGFIGSFETLAELTAAGASWARYTAGDGRLLVGAGTTFSQTFTEATNYGSAWTVTATGSVTIVIASHSATRRNANIAFGAGTDNVEDDHSHGITSQTFSGNAITYLPPMRGVIMARHV